MRPRAAFGLCVGLALVTQASCGSGLAHRATLLAERELHCAPPALRVRSVGELRVGSHAAHRVELYEASGCEQEQLYLCTTEARQCAKEIGALPWPNTQPALERALRLLRTTARARCPESELRVIQESESLFRFEACDGAWLYHCRARGCERLP